MIGYEVLLSQFIHDGVSRTWTDGNWIWHSLTNSGTIWLVDARLIPRDLGGISLYYWPILGLGLQQQIVNQCVAGTPELVTKCHQGKKEAKQLPPSEGMCNKELGRYEYVQEFGNFQLLYVHQCCWSGIDFWTRLALVLVLCPRLTFGWYEAWNNVCDIYA
jgi:hypothetical protein